MTSGTLKQLYKSGARQSFYGRRHGKRIKPSRQEAMDIAMATMRVDIPTKPLNLTKMFPNATDLWLEIGFGGGEHLAGQVLAHPDIGFIGAEPFINGVSSLVAHLGGAPANVRVLPDDIRLLFPFLPNDSFGRIFVLYPDPWPKARHEARRFLGQDNLKQLHRLLKKDGQLRFATDVADYATWAVEQINASGLFQSIKEDNTVPPPDWIPTRYEKKGLAAGRTPTYFIYRKKRS